MKIEMSNQPLINSSLLYQNLNKAGDIKLVEKVSMTEAIIKVDVGGKPNEKIVDVDFRVIEPFLMKNNLYRTYDYDYRRYTVYYEPIKLNRSIIKGLEVRSEN